jgi:hypothetical protein
MTQIATSVIGVTGTKPTFGAAAAGDTAACSARNFLVVKNGAGSPITLTVAVPGNTVNGSAQPDTVITVAATTGEAWVPLETYYKDPSDGLAHITYSSVTTVTSAVVQR